MATGVCALANFLNLSMEWRIDRRTHHRRLIFTRKWRPRFQPPGFSSLCFFFGLGFASPPSTRPSGILRDHGSCCSYFEPHRHRFIRSSTVSDTAIMRACSTVNLSQLRNFRSFWPISGSFRQISPEILSAFICAMVTTGFVLLFPDSNSHLLRWCNPILSRIGSRTASRGRKMPQIRESTGGMFFWAFSVKPVPSMRKCRKDFPRLSGTKPLSTSIRRPFTA